MKYFTLTLLLSILNCGKVKSKKTEFETKIITTQIKNFEKILKMNKSSAIERYGRPYSRKKFILNDAQGEFRNKISGHYSANLRQSETILIEEITWEMNIDSLITVWYEQKNKKSIPKDFLIWEYGSEF